MFFPQKTEIKNLYDSHVHWMYTGQVHLSWNLKCISDPQQILESPELQNHRRGDWLVGFGWDENKWNADFKIHRSFLDQKWKDQPVFLSRNDGHSSWVNTVALKILGLWNQHHKNQDIVIDQDGWPIGVLKEKAHIEALKKLPDFSSQQRKDQLIAAAHHFNQSGFTHIRDMTSNPQQWKVNQQLIADQEILLHVEHWFVCESLQDIQRTIDQVLNCKKEENAFMKIRGIKLFVDGSLGSHTAFLSQPYPDQGSRGQMNWAVQGIADCLRLVWKNKLEVALHSIGDECTHQIVKMARLVYSEGIQGVLHLEHTEILRPETIQMLKPLHVRCHLQPCHWFSDSVWLESKLQNLYSYSFPWQALEKAKVPFSFGSDSPIEKSSLIRNLEAHQQSQLKGIHGLKNDPVLYHSYPFNDSATGITIFEQDKVKSVQLGDRKIHFN